MFTFLFEPIIILNFPKEQRGELKKRRAALKFYGQEKSIFAGLRNLVSEEQKQNGIRKHRFQNLYVILYSTNQYESAVY